MNRSSYSSRLSGSSETVMVGWVGRGVGERSRLSTDEVESNEAPRELESGGARVSDVLPLDVFSRWDLRGDRLSNRGLEGAKWAANFEPREGGEMLIGGGVETGGCDEEGSDGAAL